MGGVAKAWNNPFWGLIKGGKNIGVLFKNECCHFCKKKKWQTYWTECNNHNNRFCDWPFRRDGMAGYEKHKKVTCSKACAQWRKNNNPLVSKKKEAKNDGVLFKNASWMILMKIEEPKRRGRIGRNLTTTKRLDLAPPRLSRRNGRHVNFLRPLRNGMAAPLLRVNNNIFFKVKIEFNHFRWRSAPTMGPGPSDPNLRRDLSPTFVGGCFYNQF